MDRGIQLVERLRKAKEDFGPNYPKKYGGAVAVEILRAELVKEGIPTSARDVFIRGYPCEVDILIPRLSATPQSALLYEPADVAVALEVKKTGSYAKAGLDKIKSDFSILKALGVPCAYVTFEDRETYLHRPNSERIGFPCYAFAWHKKNDGPLRQVSESEGWDALLKVVRNHYASAI